MAFICLLTGHFKNLLYFTIIIMVHELGHTLTGSILKFKINRIEIYPYGGCSKMEYDINIPIYKELLILIMGPLIQIIFVYIIRLSEMSVPDYFYTYHYFILIFNMLPIFPLDGGRLIELVTFFICSYYKGLKYVLYFSYLAFVSLFFYFVFFNFNFIVVLILILLGFQIHREIRNAKYYFNKFLMERYLYDYHFSKRKIVSDVKMMKRDYYHFFVMNNCEYVDEKRILCSYFG